MFDDAKDLARDAQRAVDDFRARRFGPLILELDLTEDLVEVARADPLAMALAYRRTALRDVIDGLRRAAADPRVRALVAKAGSTRVGLARAQELRDAVLAFRRAGKPAVAWAETFGEFGPGTIPYYLATAFDEIWLQPSGDVGLTGVSVEARFLREALDKAGVEPELGQRHEYKDAANIFIERGFTPAHRQVSARLAASIAEQVVAGVAAGRGRSPAEVKAIVDRSPLFASEARAAGLVDHLGYRDEVYAALRRRVGGEAQLQYVARYARASASDRLRRLAKRSERKVALVEGAGAIRLGRSGRSPFTPVAAMGSETVAAAFRAAIHAEDVAAIVFRVDSPGGSYVASDRIWRELVLAQRAGKPVVVSMGDVAASGGYFVAMPADAIVAQPGTLTGSIGVVGGKQVVAGLLDKLGVGHDAVAEGAHARMFSSVQRFSESEWELVDRWLDRVYDDFTARVAERRRMSRDRVDELARGRVWTGADAHEQGLVDELGGLELAVDIARQRAGLPARAAPELRVFPKASPLGRLRPAQSSEDPAAASAALFAESWGPVAALASRLQLPAGGPLVMPDLRIS
jgi:protease-4